MNKGELIESITAKTSISRTTTNQVLDAALEAIVETVASGEKVIIVNFGSFEPSDRKAREGRNPKTGEKMIIPATTVARFHPGKFFKESVKPT